MRLKLVLVFFSRIGISWPLMRSSIKLSVGSRFLNCSSLSLKSNFAKFGENETFLNSFGVLKCSVFSNFYVVRYYFVYKYHRDLNVWESIFRLKFLTEFVEDLDELL